MLRLLGEGPGVRAGVWLTPQENGMAQSPPLLTQESVPRGANREGVDEERDKPEYAEAGGEQSDRDPSAAPLCVLARRAAICGRDPRRSPDRRRRVLSRLPAARHPPARGAGGDRSGAAVACGDTHGDGRTGSVVSARPDRNDAADVDRRTGRRGALAGAERGGDSARGCL